MSRRRVGRIARTVAVLGAVAAVSWPAAAEAQRRGQADRVQRLDPQAREVLEARVRARFGETVQLQLGLTDDEMAEVQQAFGTFEGRRRELAREELELRTSLRPLLEPRGGAEALGDAEARRILGRLAELRLREAQLFRQEQEVLLETLTPAQLVRLYQLREALGSRIRMLRGGRPGGVRGPGGGGPPR